MADDATGQGAIAPKGTPAVMPSSSEGQAAAPPEGSATPQTEEQGTGSADIPQTYEELAKSYQELRSTRDQAIQAAKVESDGYRELIMSNQVMHDEAMRLANQQQVMPGVPATPQAPIADSPTPPVEPVAPTPQDPETQMQAELAQAFEMSLTDPDTSAKSVMNIMKQQAETIRQDTQRQMEEQFAPVRQQEIQSEWNQQTQYYKDTFDIDLHAKEHNDRLFQADKAIRADRARRGDPVPDNVPLSPALITSVAMRDALVNMGQTSAQTAEARRVAHLEASSTPESSAPVSSVNIPASTGIRSTAEVMAEVRAELEQARR